MVICFCPDFSPTQQPLESFRVIHKKTILYIPALHSPNPSIWHCIAPGFVFLPNTQGFTLGFNITLLQSLKKHNCLVIYVSIPLLFQGGPCQTCVSRLGVMTYSVMTGWSGLLRASLSSSRWSGFITL